MGFELGFEKNNLLGNGIRTPPSRPSMKESQKLHFLFLACNLSQGSFHLPCDNVDNSWQIINRNSVS